MRANRVREMLAQGLVPVGHMVSEFPTRGMARILEVAGADFALVDMEHSGLSAADVADQMAWLRGTAVVPLVRVPQAEYHFIARALDAGALGVMVPDVKDGAQARAIVAAAKYPPLGQRGLVTGGANTAYEPMDAAEYMAWANENTLILCQIESQEGLDHLDEIAATPGVDVLWVGHGDMTKSLGIPGDYRHPRFIAALRQVAEAARRHGLAAGVQPNSVEQAQEWMALGYNIISYSADARVYGAAVAQGIAGVRRIAI